jgi:hypothetical protein
VNSSSGSVQSRRIFRWVIGVGLFGATLWTIPRAWCGRESAAWWAGDAALQGRLARGVEDWLRRDLSRAEFTTGSDLFNGEWLFGTYLMAGLGFGQTAVLHPEWKTRHLELMERCIERMLSPEVRAFDVEQWRADPLDRLDQEHGHAAYLGYLNVLLGFHRLLNPDSRFADLNDSITRALVRRVAGSPTRLLETYPGEVYPVDNCAVIGSIGLYDRATGADHRALIADWSATCRARYCDPATGLLIQALDTDGAPADQPRGSGTSLGLYFLAWADPELARDLYRAIRENLATDVMGLGAVREYPRGRRGRGDIDSGPVILGFSFSATGFALAGGRMFGDRDYYRKLCATAYLAGTPVDRGDARRYVTGGPLGSAILLAVLTALPESEWPEGRTP